MKRSALSVLGIAGLLALTGCLETMPGPDRPHRPRPEKPAICTREYAPVCAERGRKRQTFSNACMAHAKGYDVLQPGECRGGGR